MGDAYRKAAEQNAFAVRAHRNAAGHRRKGNDVPGNCHADQALERRAVLLLWVIANLAGVAATAKAHSLPDLEDPPGTAATTIPAQPGQLYSRPAQKTRLRNFLFDALGPYPIAGAALAAGIGQASNAPPEWKQGAEGYGKRFASDFGIAAVSTTTRYALARVFKEDTLYYRCDCTGVFPRLRHAVASTFTARRGDDGHRVFSIPALVGIYAGTFTATYGWYPSRYGVQDALRMGNYNLLASVGGNIALEFLYGGPHSLLSRIHLDNRHGAPNPGSKP